ncbi:orion [Carabus blaptoides fortunei]
MKHGQLLWGDSLHHIAHPEVEMLRRYAKISEEMETAISGGFADDLAPLKDIEIVDRIRDDLRSVNEIYESFRSFQKYEADSRKLFIPQDTWTDLADTILNNPISSIPNTLQRIHNLIVAVNLFQQVLQVIVEKNCDYDQSPAQVLYNLYNMVAWTQLKGYMLIQFSAQVYELFGKEGNHRSEAILLRRKYQHNALVTANAVKSAMKIASRQLWKCDPTTHDKDKTYTELNRLLQGYLVNEEDLSGEKNCKKSCDAYQYTAKHKCSVGKYYCEDPVCDGAVYNCQFIDADMSVCPGKTENRRYTYINYENGRKLGYDQTCNTSERKVDSWWKFFVHCAYCMCICADLQHSDRYFNLREYSADTKNNRVVTGLKFVKVNSVIHLQIQQGQLLPYGVINQTTIHWQQVDNYEVNDGTLIKKYHTLSWKERGIDLDEVVVPDEHVVTGVRFRLAGANLKLEILASPINFTSGKLMETASRSTWHSNFDPSNKRSELNLDNRDVPTKASSPSKMISTSGQYLRFTHTGIEADVAQSTVPFIDVQPVVSDLPVPLGGVGVYYKGEEGFGGFIAPKIITYDYSKYIEVASTAMRDP